MANQVKIPDNMYPNWECRINGKAYSYPAGTEQSVPEEVAELIEQMEDMEPDGVDVGGGAEPDMVITLSAEPATTNTTAEWKVTSGSASNVVDAVRAGRQPSVKVCIRNQENDAYTPLRGEVDS